MARRGDIINRSQCQLYPSRDRRRLRVRRSLHIEVPLIIANPPPTTGRPDVFTRTNSVPNELHTKRCVFTKWLHLNCRNDIFRYIADRKMIFLNRYNICTDKSLQSRTWIVQILKIHFHCSIDDNLCGVRARASTALQQANNTRVGIRSRSVSVKTGRPGRTRDAGGLVVPSGTGPEPGRTGRQWRASMTQTGVSRRRTRIVGEPIRLPSGFSDNDERKKS